jgi:hypothetical protein
MIRLNSERDIIISLISKVLGNNRFTFILPNKENTVLEFRSEDYKFIMSIYEDKLEDLLRVYDNGNIYIIKNTLSGCIEDIKTTCDCILEEYNDLKEFYRKEKSETKSGVIYTFERI